MIHVPYIHTSKHTFRKAAVGCLSVVSLLGSLSAGATTLADRISAATSTVANNSACTDISYFYWEIGDQTQTLASGTGGKQVWGVPSPPASSDVMKIASASKWVFGAYVSEVQGGSFSAADLEYLRMRAGYPGLTYHRLKKFTQCQSGQTVYECHTYNQNDYHNSNDEGKFNYGGGHYQAMASIELGLGSKTTTTLATEVNSVLGTGFSYDNPGLAGGAESSADNYAAFLRSILSGNLVISSLLGSNAVATDTTDTIYSPVSDPWHYSLGHWVETDGTFSSPGAQGFYPWIDSSETYYGIIARERAGGSEDSVACGQVVREAWFAGSPVL